MRRVPRTIALTVATLLLLGTPGIAQDAVAPNRTPQVWAVIVGIEKYADKTIPPCEGAIGDETALVSWLREFPGWDNNNVLRLDENGTTNHGLPVTNVRNLKPTRENLDFALKGWLGSRVQENDVVVFYFAGHAVALPPKPDAKGPAIRELLLPQDARKDDLERTGWSPDEGLDAVAAKNPRAIISLLDTSLSGRGAAVGPPPGPRSTITFLSRLARWPRSTAWIAADGKPSAGPTKTEPHGSLTAALVKGFGSKPANLLSALNVANRDPILSGQGFRTVGEIGPEVNLWSQRAVNPKDFLPKLLLQQGHAAAVTAMAISPAGDKIATASKDSTVKLWRISDRRLLRVFAEQNVEVKAMALSADGTYLVTGDGLGEVRVYDLTKPPDTGTRQVLDRPHDASVASVEFLPDGVHFISMDTKNEVAIWDLGQPQLRSVSLFDRPSRRVACASATGNAAVAAVGKDGRLRFLASPDRKPLSVTGPSTLVTSLDLSFDGKLAAVGDEDGLVWIVDAGTGQVLSKPQFGKEIVLLKFAENGRLAVAVGDGLMLIDPKVPNGPRISLEFDGPADSAGFSKDSKWLAAVSKIGTLHLWDINVDGKAARKVLEGAEALGSFRSFAFSSDSRTIAAGEASGGFRTWGIPDGGLATRVPSHRGRVRNLAVGPGEDGQGRYLLQITDDGIAQIWDLKELKNGETVQTLPGRWKSGAFLPPDNTRIIMSRDPDEGGDVVAVDRETGKVLHNYPRPPARDGGESKIDFDRVAVSNDGLSIAAAAADGRRPIACVWNVNDGPPITFSKHTDSLTSIGFSPDGKSLITSGKDGKALLWDLSKGPDQAVKSFSAKPGEIITAAVIVPGNPLRVATCRFSATDFNSWVELWDASQAAPKPVLLTPNGLRGYIPALSVTPDGLSLAVAGTSRMMNIWDLGKTIASVKLNPIEFHEEQVTSLIAWPKGKQFASGSDDATVRLWTPIEGKAASWSLLGTLSAAPPEFEGPPKARTSTEWIAFTPEGKFDSSLQGEHLVTFVEDQEVRPLEQYFDRYYESGLGEKLRLGKRDDPAESRKPKAYLTIDPPPEKVSPTRQTKLVISLSDPGLKARDLRLYHNNQPVQTVEDFQSEGESGTKFVATVTLKGGINKFYAMAGSKEGVDARSRDVELAFDAPEDKGKLHILALGISKYATNALKFADVDAKAISDLMNDRALAGGRLPGKQFLLRDDQVNEASIKEKLQEIKETVKGHPEDTVVVFLAGHTGIVRTTPDNPRFSLLTANFPFPAETPQVSASRGLSNGYTVAPDEAYIPYYMLSFYLSKMEALQRLVIVDACQAEAILDDEGVLQVQRLMDSRARKAKTSYLLAARKGVGSPGTELEFAL